MNQELKDRLMELRLKILQQHKIMMEFERRDFEALFGKVSAGELLQLLINHAQFAWLHRLSEFVVLIDETMADKEFPLTDQNAEDYIAQARAIFDPENPDLEFRERYQAIVEDDPEAFEKHGEIGDTAVRDKMYDAIHHGSIQPKPKYTLPATFGMFSEEGDQLVRTDLCADERLCSQMVRRYRRSGASGSPRRPGGRRPG